MADVTLKPSIQELKDSMRASVERALEAVGLQAEGYAKMKCPVDTGNLRNSITHTTDEGELTAYIGTDVEYAAYVEYGTSRTKAQPYLEPAIKEHKDEYKKIFVQFINNS